MDGQGPLLGGLVEERLLLGQLVDDSHVAGWNLAVLGIAVGVQLLLLHVPEGLLELRELLNSSREGVLLVDQDRHAGSKVLQGVVPDLHAGLPVRGISMRLHAALTQSAERLVHASVVAAWCPTLPCRPGQLSSSRPGAACSRR